MPSDIYIAKKLIEGTSLNPPILGCYLVSCMANKKYKAIQFGDRLMGLEGKVPVREVIVSREMPYRGTYPLVYYKWEPETDLWGKPI